MITATVHMIQIVSGPRSTQDNVQVSVQLNDAAQTYCHARNKTTTIGSMFNRCRSVTVSLGTICSNIAKMMQFG